MTALERERQQNKPHYRRGLIEYVFTVFIVETNRNLRIGTWKGCVTVPSRVILISVQQASILIYSFLIQAVWRNNYRIQINSKLYNVRQWTVSVVVMLSYENSPYGVLFVYFTSSMTEDDKFKYT